MSKSINWNNGFILAGFQHWGWEEYLDTYRVVFRGIIVPFVKVWTSKINGIMDKTL